MTAYMRLLLVTAFMLGGCVSSASYQIRSNEVRAACAAQVSLQSSGYLEPLETLEPSTIDLEL